jgi:ankyrin repeat protein
VENLGLTVDHYSLNKFGFRSPAYISVRDKINSLLQSMDPSRQHGYKNDEHRDCHRAFKNSTYEQFKNINPDRVEQTCQWALSHPLYQRWRDNATGDLLWISADPGCGKSVLSKSLVDEELLGDANGSTVCYFFFKDNDEQNSLATCLCTLLHQLFQHQPHLIQHAVPAWNTNASNLVREIDELWRILLAVTSDLAARNTIFVLDALDECKAADRSNLIAKLSRFYENATSQTGRQPRLKFVVTSRPYNEIQRDFHHIPSSLPAIRIHGEEENDQIRAEINRVIEVRVSKLGAELQLKKDLRDRLTKKLLGMEHRTYLWLHLAMDAIRTALTNLRPNEEAIVSVPQSVQAAYEEILRRIPKEGEKDAKVILQIIVGARRPLTVAEMALALGAATTKQGRRSNDVGIDPKHLKDRIRDWCGLFVFINDSKIFLIHQTAREFLIRKVSDGMEHSINTTWRHCIQQAQMEQMMTVICITCLNLEDRETLCGDDISASIEGGNNGDQNFIEYCCRWWTAHYTMSQDASGEDTFQDVLALYDIEGTAFKFWFDRSMTRTLRTKSMTQLRLAVLGNHYNVLEHLLSKIGPDLEEKDEEGRTALHLASGLGHDNIVRTLLNGGADVNAQSNGDYSNALQAASAKGYDNVVQMLLEKGAHDYQRGNCGGALREASGEGHEKIVQLLLDKRAYNVQSEGYCETLSAASEGGHEKIVKLLLDKCADNAQGERYGKALSTASARGHARIVKILLDKGIDVNARPSMYGSALQAASAEGHDKIVQMLLDKGADVNAQGGVFGSAVRKAAAVGHNKIVQVLLDRGADVNAQDGTHGSALQAATSRGQVKMLLDRGADVKTKSRVHGSALQAALEGGFDKIP